jgi:hypothetical protein
MCHLNYRLSNNKIKQLTCEQIAQDHIANTAQAVTAILNDDAGMAVSFLHKLVFVEFQG